MLDNACDDSDVCNLIAVYFVHKGASLDDCCSVLGNTVNTTAYSPSAEMML